MDLAFVFLSGATNKSSTRSNSSEREFHWVSPFLSVASAFARVFSPFHMLKQCAAEQVSHMIKMKSFNLCRSNALNAHKKGSVSGFLTRINEHEEFQQEKRRKKSVVRPVNAND
jgi:hypothetical protein